jgi:ubiquinone/menaquinone biosynthesis C-methylase UbiE
MLQWAFTLSSPVQVVEIGAGSGINCEHMNTSHTMGIQLQYYALEPNPSMWPMLHQRCSVSNITPIALPSLDNGTIPMPSQSVDIVLSTFVLCTVPDPSLTLKEIKRILRKGGRFYFLGNPPILNPIDSNRTCT